MEPDKGGRTEAEHCLASLHGAYGYHHHVHVDDTEEGFPQLVILVIMGGQFCLSRLACYNGGTIVCTHVAFEALASAGLTGGCCPRWVCDEARATTVALKVPGAVQYCQLRSAPPAGARR